MLHFVEQTPMARMTSSAQLVPEQPEPLKKASRTRSSATAIENALAAVKRSGLSVERLLVKGGQVEIVIGGNDARAQQQQNGELQEWS